MHCTTQKPNKVDTECLREVYSLHADWSTSCSQQHRDGHCLPVPVKGKRKQGTRGKKKGRGGGVTEEHASLIRAGWGLQKDVVDEGGSQGGGLREGALRRGGVDMAQIFTCAGCGNRGKVVTLLEPLRLPCAAYCENQSPCLHHTHSLHNGFSGFEMEHVTAVCEQAMQCHHMASGMCQGKTG